MSSRSLGFVVFTVAIALFAQRGPSSGSSKKVVFSQASLGAAKHTFKVRGPVSVAVELVGARPNSEGDVFVLRGVITSSETLHGVEYKWNIPAELELVNGSKTSAIPDLIADHPYSVQLTLRQKSFANGRVHFRARGMSGDMKFGDSAQYNSMMQEALESSRAELKKSAEEEFAAQKTAGVVPNRKNIQFNEKPLHHGGLKIIY